MKTLTLTMSDGQYQTLVDLALASDKPIHETALAAIGIGIIVLAARRAEGQQP